MDKIVTKKNYDVHIYEVDSHGKANIVSIMSYLEDLATYQTEKLGMSLKYFRDNKIAWVVYKWEIHMDKYPEYGDTIEVSTLPYSIRKFYAYRKYEIFNKGERIGYANSLWFLINTEKRKPCRITDNIYKMYNLTEEDNEQIPFDRLRKLKQVDYKNSFKVRYSDIDTNKHVNNVKYVSWALETVSEEILNDYKLKQLKIDYDKETAYGEAIKVFSETIEIDDGYIIYTSLLNSNGEKLSLVKTIWSK